MTRKAGWEGSTSGPDWMDVRGMLSAIAALHSGDVALVILPDGTGGSGGLDVVGSMLFDVLPGSSLPQAVMAHSEWPCDKHATLAAHALSVLYELDHEISKVYQNEKLWE